MSRGAAVRELVAVAVANPLGHELIANESGGGFTFGRLDMQPEHDELAMQRAVDALTNPELDALLGGLRALEARIYSEAQRRRRLGIAIGIDDLGIDDTITAEPEQPWLSLGTPEHTDLPPPARDYSRTAWITAFGFGLGVWAVLIIVLIAIR